MSEHRQPAFDESPSSGDTSSATEGGAASAASPPSALSDIALESNPLIVAALYVYDDGVYDSDELFTELWTKEEDARHYCGPHPVVAHPPCKRWSLMANCRKQRDGQDEGCFKAALFDVRRWGGVLEQPAHSLAWEWFDLPKPQPEGWTQALSDGGWVCEVDQRWYGHEANKPTWLYYVGGPEPFDLKWGRAPKGAKTVGRSWGQGRDHQRSATPPAFRDVLLALARRSRYQELAA